jgi:hypothetical protein
MVSVPRDGRYKRDLEMLEIRLLSIFVNFIAAGPGPGEPNQCEPGTRSGSETQKKIINVMQFTFFE